MSNETFRFVTDTSTMCIFDLACLKHRLMDDADWWSVPSAELEEVNAGNVAFLNLGGDGEYCFSIEEVLPDAQIEINLQVKSGKVFLGAGEEVSSDGLEPEGLRGGIFLDISPGNYIVHAKRDGRSLTLALTKNGRIGNTFEVPVRI